MIKHSFLALTISALLSASTLAADGQNAVDNDSASLQDATTEETSVLASNEMLDDFDDLRDFDVSIPQMATKSTAPVAAAPAIAAPSAPMMPGKAPVNPMVPGVGPIMNPPMPTAVPPVAAAQTAAVTAGQSAVTYLNQESTAEINEVNERTHVIRVLVNSSLIVKLKKPATRVSLADPQIADVLVSTPEQVVVLGKSVGTTQLLLEQDGNHEVFHVVVEPNMAVLNDLIQSIAPTSTVKVRVINGKLVLIGKVPDAETAKQVDQMAGLFQGSGVINQLVIAGNQQTMLRVVVAEVNKDAMRSLGFNWAVGGSKWSRDIFFSNNLGQLNPTTFGSNGLPDVTQGQLLYSVLPNANTAQTNVTFGFPRAELQFFLNALRENGLARTLAEPNLVAISGQTATFLAGGEVPIPVAQGGAVAGAITIEYKEFGVRLAFTPTMMAGQMLRLHVMSEVSDAVPDSRVIGGLPLYTFITRRVESTVECGNGQSFAIAGLLNERVNAIASKIPGLGDIPILGTMFSSVDYQKSRTELVVIVTPELVEPIEPDQVITPPGTDMTDPNDFELFTLQQLEGARKRGTGLWEGTGHSKCEEPPVELVGPYGISDQDNELTMKEPN